MISLRPQKSLLYKILSDPRAIAQAIHESHHWSSLEEASEHGRIRAQDADDWAADLEARAARSIRPTVDPVTRGLNQDPDPDH